MSDQEQQTKLEGGESVSAAGLGGWWKRLLAFLWPMCPTGQHRMKMGLVTNINGNQFCWHPDCMAANLADCKTHAHNFEPAFSYAGKLFERCACGAHRIYGALPDGTGARAHAKAMRRLEIRERALKTPNEPS